MSVFGEAAASGWLSTGIRSAMGGLWAEFFHSGALAALVVLGFAFTLAFVLYRIVNGGKQGG